jgi:hypothetical protein
MRLTAVIDVHSYDVSDTLNSIITMAAFTNLADILEEDEELLRAVTGLESFDVENIFSKYCGEGTCIPTR